MSERILCAAVYVDTGKDEERRSYAYPETGLRFCGYRHPDCFTTMFAWADRLTDEERAAINAIDPHQLQGTRQGFLTSRGRFVGRTEAARIAFAAGQLKREIGRLTSEDLY